MTAEIPPIVSERREGERRAGWHTPDDCPKMLDVQKAMDSIFEQLEEGRIRMGCMEDNIAGNHRVLCDDLKDLHEMQRENKKALAENTAKTNDTYEILEMGRGFFKGIAFTGKWLRRIVMWVVPPVVAIIGLWHAVTNRHP